MNRTVNKDRTLLVDGPASVTLVSGKAEVLGQAIAVAGKVVIREGKRLPFAVFETAVFDISLGEGATVEEIEGSTIPASWKESCEELLKNDSRPAVAIVLGNVDCGKSSFCTYLANKALSEKRKIAILDGDLGQSDIGPPSTISFALVTKPITDLFNLQAKDTCFIGDTSPIRDADRVVEGLVLLKNETPADDPDLLIINTDGWIEGECAIKYKTHLVEKLNPNVVFCIQREHDLTPLLAALGKFKTVIVESPPMIKQRTIEKRRTLRELGYIKYLKNAKVQSLSLSWVDIQGNELFDLCKTRMSVKQSSRVYALLGMKPLHISELSDRICVVIGRRRWIDSENIKKVEELTKKRVIVTRKGEEEGLLTALHNAEKRFLGLGVLQEIDYLRKTLKVYTPVAGEISMLKLGRIKLDKNMKEMPAITEEGPIDFTSFKKLF